MSRVLNGAPPSKGLPPLRIWRGRQGGRTPRNPLQVFEAFFNDLFPRSRLTALVLDAWRHGGFAAAA
jgi:hypothetical protein